MNAHAAPHTHSTRHDAPVDPWARRLLMAALALVGLATLAGVVHLWPEDDPRLALGSPTTQFSAPGVAFEKAEVRRLLPSCPTDDDRAGSAQPADDATCGVADVRVLTGDRKGEEATIQVAPEITRSGLRPGDRVDVMELPEQADGQSVFAFFSTDRNVALLWMSAILVVVVGAVARLRGLLALVGLAFAGIVVVRFMLPALLDGRSGLAVALVGAAAIMYVVLYLAHGPSVRTSAALAGTLVGIALIAVLSVLAIRATRLSGISDETGSILQSTAGRLDFQGLLTCALIVAGLGILNDVTITQASAVWELRAAAPGLSRRRLFSGAVRIGRDHIASTVYTIAFAYAGASLSVLLLLYLYDRPVLSLLSTEDITEEIVRTIVATVGLVLAVPSTTAIATAVVEGRDANENDSHYAVDPPS